jgi:hypothetical protein
VEGTIRNTLYILCSVDHVSVYIHLKKNQLGAQLIQHSHDNSHLKRNNQYQLLYPYGVPPDDGL